MKAVIAMVLALIVMSKVPAQPPVEIIKNTLFNEDLVHFYNGMAVVKQNYKYSIRKPNGDFAVPGEYEFMGTDLSQGLVLVKKNGKYGYIDLTGQMVIEPVYKSSTEFKNGYAIVYETSESYLIDSKGTKVFSHTGGMSSVGDNGWVAVSEKGKAFKYVDLNKNVMLEGSYVFAEGFEKGRAIVETSKGQYNLIDEKGNIKGKAYATIKRTASGYFIVEDKKSDNELFGPQGLIDAEGKELIAPVNKRIYAESVPVGVQKKANECYFIDAQTGKKLFNTNYSAITSFANGYALVQKDAQAYYIDKTGKAVTKPVKGNYDLYDMGSGVVRLIPVAYWAMLDPKTKMEKKLFGSIAFAGSRDGFIVYYFMSGGKKMYGLMNEQGKIIIEANYLELRLFEKGYTAVKENDFYQLFSPEGKIMMNGDKFARADMSDDMFWLITAGAKDMNEAFYADLTGKKINVPVDYAKYKYAMAFMNGLSLAVDKKGMVGFIDVKGNEVIPCKYESASKFGKDGIVLVKLYNRWGAIDKTGKEIVPCSNSDMEQLYNGLLAAENSNKWYVYYLDRSITNESFQAVLPSGNGLIPVKNNDKWGYIDASAKVVIPYKFASAGVFNNGITYTSSSYKYGFINTKGEQVIDEKYWDAFLSSNGIPFGQKIDDKMVIRNPLYK